MHVLSCFFCSFLVEYCGLNLDGALEEFAAASPPGIYSRRYLEVRMSLWWLWCSVYTD